MTTSDTPSDRDPFDAVAEDFVERYRRGERPSITECVAQHPHLAERIKRLFPTLAAIERAVPADVSRVVTSTCAPLDSEPPQKQLGDFRIIRELGRGGMGVVYEAEQQSLGRRVALKVLWTPALIDSHRRERFLREARTASRLHHTNIVPVYGIGEEHDVCYYAMQLIVGRGLDDVLEELRRWREAPPADDAESPELALRRTVGSSGSSASAQATYWTSVARIALQVADALAYAHGQGLVHRDIKPSNLLLDSQGNMWVTDFGLAKADDDGDLTRTGDIIGTLRYMAPERLEGLADARSDVYSLGLTLYELATTRPAFPSDDRSALIHQVTHLTPPPPRRVNPDVPADLETVILKCIARDPGDRYRRAENVAADLRCVLEKRPVQARRASVQERFWRWCLRNPAVAALSACIALLLCVLAAFGTHTTWKLSRQNDAIRQNLHWAREAEREARRQADKAQRAEAAQREMKRTANCQLFASYLDQAAALRAIRRPGQRTAALRAVLAAAALADDIHAAAAERQRLKDEAAAALAQFDMTVKETWPDELPVTSQNRVAFSPDGELFARAEPGRQLVVRRMADGSTVHAIDLLDSLEDDRPRPFFSPDGQYVLAKGSRPDGRNHVVCVWNVGIDFRAPLVARIEVGGSRFDQALDVAPDSQSCVCLNREGQVELRGLADGKWIGTLSSLTIADGLRFSPDGQHVLIWSGADIEVLGLSSGHAAHFKLPARLDCVVWRNDGKVIAGGGEDGHVYIVDARDGNVQSQCVGHQSEVREVAFHPHVDLLASSSWDGTVRLWDLRHGQEVLRTTGALGTFSRDGRFLGFTGTQSVGRWEVSGVPWMSVLAAGDQTIRSVRFSRNGDILFAGTAQSVGIWNARSGRKLATIPDVADVSDHPVLDAWCTAGAGGVLIWPHRQEARSLLVGPPEVVIPFQCDSVQIDPSGRSWLMTSARSVVHWVGRPSDKPMLDHLQRWTQDRLRFAEQSPGGRWVSAAGWNVPGISVWTSGHPDPVAMLAAPRGGRVAFSPDGAWLGVSLLDQYVLFRTVSWKPGHSFPSRAPQFGALAWAPNGCSLALVLEPGRLQIVEFPSCRPGWNFELPKGELIASLTYSSDGRGLAAGMRGGAVYRWNLAQLSAELAALGIEGMPHPPLSDPTGTRNTIESVQILLE